MIQNIESKRTSAVLSSVHSDLKRIEIGSKGSFLVIDNGKEDKIFWNRKNSHYLIINKNCIFKQSLYL